MYLFGLYVSASENKCNGLLKADECTKNYQAIKFIPTLTIVSALVPIVFVYTVFFISQWEYYLSGFVGELPEDLSYAQYAREGFFQLCIVSVINLVIILFVALFMRRKVEEKSVVFRIISIIFTICNFILISTALSKMVMYIKSYGLTPKRIYATWFMCLIAVIFLIIVVSQFINKIKPIATTFVVCVLFLTGLSLSNIDRIIAGYNVDRYIDGSLNSVDMRAMEDLGDAAIPELVRLAEHLDSKYNTDISAEKCGSEDELYQNLHKKLHDTADYYKSHNDDMSIFEKNIPVVRAENALKRVNLG